MLRERARRGEGRLLFRTMRGPSPTPRSEPCRDTGRVVPPCEHHDGSGGKDGATGRVRAEAARQEASGSGNQNSHSCFLFLAISEPCTSCRASSGNRVAAWVAAKLRPAPMADAARSDFVRKTGASYQSHSSRSTSYGFSRMTPSYELPLIMPRLLPAMGTVFSSPVVFT